ncbi:hypothetical protein Anas_11201 [Armadillidium nasatum]|uniref:Uncharacterized protein n=1 Tax=Armadillidium nasatum TaxID=96803 RepID=A0A5N5SMQ6_9CRUS|nr:hypothetical protein Anas_11201 [Armadillidium nasatum]
MASEFEPTFRMKEKRKKICMRSSGNFVWKEVTYNYLNINLERQKLNICICNLNMFCLSRNIAPRSTKIFLKANRSECGILEILPYNESIVKIWISKKSEITNNAETNIFSSGRKIESLYLY